MSASTTRFPTEATIAALPPGREVSRKTRNLRPGQVIIPAEWAGTKDSSGMGTEWAIVTGWPMWLELQDLFTGVRRKECRIPVRYPHEAEGFTGCFDGNDMPVLILGKKAAELLLAGDQP